MREKRQTRTHIDFDLLFYLFMHSLVDSCMCPDRGLNPRPWTMLQLTELPSQGCSALLPVIIFQPYPCVHNQLLLAFLGWQAELIE